MKTSAFRPSVLLIAAALSVGPLLAGCDRDQQVQSYTTPKETASSETSAGPMENAGGQLPAGQSNMASADTMDLRWTLPAGWKQVEIPADASAFFRPDARIQVDANDPKLVLTISHLGDSPAARSVLQNVNRWERQEGLPESSEVELPKVVATTKVGDVTVDRVDLNGSGKELLGAIVPHAQQTWFLKLTGPTASIASHKAEFDAFLQSIHFEQNAPQPSQGETLAQATTPAGMNWQVPDGWTTQPAMPPLLAKFVAGNGAITIKVSSFAAGNFGGLEANLDRWHAEVDLPPVAASQVQDVPETTIGSRKWKIYDFSGPESAGANRKRVVVGQTEQNGEVYFFKMLGPADAVGQQRAAFDKFLSSVQLGQ